ncbi:hypothetical protein FACS1894170_00220 [Planctomycetales bacterium]|nr:hypothetical protein FACS1894170_00220 [Planctomycetales bacterium]
MRYNAQEFIFIDRGWKQKNKTQGVFHGKKSGGQDSSAGEKGSEKSAGIGENKSRIAETGEEY